MASLLPSYLLTYSQSISYTKPISCTILPIQKTNAAAVFLTGQDYAENWVDSECEGKYGGNRETARRKNDRKHACSGQSLTAVLCRCSACKKSRPRSRHQVLEICVNTARRKVFEIFVQSDEAWDEWKEEDEKYPHPPQLIDFKSTNFKCDANTSFTNMKYFDRTERKGRSYL